MKSLLIFSLCFITFSVSAATFTGRLVENKVFNSIEFNLYSPKGTFLVRGPLELLKPADDKIVTVEGKMAFVNGRMAVSADKVTLLKNDSLKGEIRVYPAEDNLDKIFLVTSNDMPRLFLTEGFDDLKTQDSKDYEVTGVLVRPPQAAEDTIIVQSYKKIQ